MAFYICPPRGTSQLSKLETMTHKRLEFLVGVYTCNGNTVSMRDLLEKESTITGSECLIEGSKRDSISHFNLRLASSQSSEMVDFFLRAENLLFRYRFSCMNKEELLACIKPLKRFQRKTKDMIQTTKSGKLEDILKFLHLLRKQYSWESLVCLYLDGSKKTIRVPFQYVFPLVAKREVVLEHGIVIVPVTKLCDLFSFLFDMFLRYGVELCKNEISHAIEDERMTRLYKSLKYKFQRSVIHSGVGLHGHIDPVRHEEIDELAEYFPPCMAHLHSELRRKHRLRHFSRIQYTLYLKEIGLPVHEAIQFWRSEYSQPQTQFIKDKGSCDHTWNKDWKRYIYSIRHLYGLEGARVNYRSHCCSSLQAENYSPIEEGGCLFVRCDREHLSKELCSQVARADDHMEILALAESGQYLQACQRLFTSKVSSLSCVHLKREVMKSQKLQIVTQGKEYETDCLDCNSLDSESSCGSQDLFDTVESQEENKEINVSCYNHKSCPPSQAICLSREKSKHEINFTLHKPVDFYFTYQKLVQGLKCTTSQ